MIRTCVICRKKSHPSHFFRIKADSQNQLIIVEHSASGRTAWVCMHAKCLRALEENPKRANRGLKTKISGSINLVEYATSNIDMRIKREIQHAFRSGLIQKIKSDAEHFQKKTGVFIEERKTDHWYQEKVENSVMQFNLPRKEAYFESWFGRREMSKIAVLQNRRIALLTRHLRVAIGLR